MHPARVPIERVHRGALLDALPVTAADLKQWLRVTHSGEDSLMALIVDRAHAMAERLVGRTITKRSMTATLDAIPYARGEWWDGVRDGALSRDLISALALPLPPLLSVESITSYNDSDVGTVMPTSDYFVDTSSEDHEGRICLRIGATWPIFLRPRNGIVIAYTGGFAVGTVPGEYKHAILVLAAYLFKNRGDCGDDQCGSQSGAAAILAPYRVQKLWN